MASILGHSARCLDTTTSLTFVYTCGTPSHSSASTNLWSAQDPTIDTTITTGLPWLWVVV